MRAAAARLKVYVGYTYLEAADGNIFNTFELVSPDGTAWICRKTQPGGLEAFVFDKTAFNSVLRTPIGVFAVQIGSESFLRRHQQDIVEVRPCASVYVVLSPRCAPAWRVCSCIYLRHDRCCLCMGRVSATVRMDVMTWILSSRRQPMPHRSKVCD